MLKAAVSRAVASRRFRLGVDFHVWDGLFQGSRSHILGLYRAAIRMAPDIDFVFFLSDTASLASAYEEFRAPNVELVRMAHRPALWRLGLQLPWLQLRHRLDLLHMQYRVPFLRLGRVAVTVHDLLFETHPQYFSRFFVWQSKLTFRMSTRVASTVLTVSDFSKRELERLYGVQPDCITVTCNGVDREIFHPGEDGEDKVRALGLVPGQYILTVGRLEPRKNHANLVRAFAKLPTDSPPLVIVGQRDFSFDGLFKAIDELGLAKRILVLERVTDLELPALMRHARVFAYPAFAEGFGMPVAEAMASGVPVVTANTTSLPEVAGPGALLVDPNSPDEIHRALSDLLGNEQLCGQLVAAGLRHVERFNWEVSARALLSRVREDVRR